MEQDTKIKILVVEDDISLKDSLVRLLQNRDFLVQAVENKQQAVEQIMSFVTILLGLHWQMEYGV